jgi:hypothetical protein
MILAASAAAGYAIMQHRRQQATCQRERKLAFVLRIVR